MAVFYFSKAAPGGPAVPMPVARAPEGSPELLSGSIADPSQIHCGLVVDWLRASRAPQGSSGSFGLLRAPEDSPELLSQKVPALRPR